MKYILTCAFLFYCIHQLSGQEVEWQKDFKSNTQDYLTGLTVTTDGDFVIAGSSIQPSKVTSASMGGTKSQNNGYDFKLVKLNKKGEQLWERYYSGNHHDFLTSLISTLDGGYLLSGTSYSFKSGDKKSHGFGGADIWLIKVDKDGNEEWQRTIGTAKHDDAKSIIQNSEGEYFIATSIQDDNSGFGKKDVWLIKLDAAGKPIKEIILGGNASDEVQRMEPTKDGGLLLGIYSRSGVFVEVNTRKHTNKKRRENSSKNIETENSASLRQLPRKEKFFSDKDKVDTKRNLVKNTENESPQNPSSNNEQMTITRSSFAKNTENYGEGDFWIIKVNNDGDIEWEKNYGGTGDDRITTMAIADNDFIVGGASRSTNNGNKSTSNEEGTDVWVITLDEKGNEKFQKTYSLGKRDVLRSMNAFRHHQQSEIGGYLLGGYSQAEGRAKIDDETFWMLHIDIEGNEVWRRYVDGKSKGKIERLVSAQLLPNGSYILAGTSSGKTGKENWKIVKLGNSQIENLIEKQQIRIYPNPVSEYCYVEIGFDFKNVVIELFDMSGRLLQSTSTPNRITKINTARLAQGAYLIVATAHTEKETKTMNAKLIKK